MDFWLSFVAVISTFIYMVSASEAMKRGILSVVWILTALMALSDATRLVFTIYLPFSQIYEISPSLANLNFSYDVSNLKFFAVPETLSL